MSVPPLTPTTVGCTRFEPNAFKKQMCKDCGRSFLEHLGIISDVHLKAASDAWLKSNGPVANSNGSTPSGQKSGDLQISAGFINHVHNNGNVSNEQKGGSTGSVPSKINDNALDGEQARIKAFEERLARQKAAKNLQNNNGANGGANGNSNSTNDAVDDWFNSTTSTNAVPGQTKSQNDSVPISSPNDGMEFKMVSAEEVAKANEMKKKMGNRQIQVKNLIDFAELEEDTNDITSQQQQSQTGPPGPGAAAVVPQPPPPPGVTTQIDQLSNTNTSSQQALDNALLGATQGMNIMQEKSADPSLSIDDLRFELTMMKEEKQIELSIQKENYEEKLLKKEEEIEGLKKKIEEISGPSGGGSGPSGPSDTSTLLNESLQKSESEKQLLITQNESLQLELQQHKEQLSIHKQQIEVQLQQLDSQLKEHSEQLRLQAEQHSKQLSEEQGKLDQTISDHAEMLQTQANQHSLRSEEIKTQYEEKKSILAAEIAQLKQNIETQALVHNETISNLRKEAENVHDVVLKDNLEQHKENLQKMKDQHSAELEHKEKSIKKIKEDHMRQIEDRDKFIEKLKEQHVNELSQKDKLIEQAVEVVKKEQEKEKIQSEQVLIEEVERLKRKLEQSDSEAKYLSQDLDKIKDLDRAKQTQLESLNKQIDEYRKDSVSHKESIDQIQKLKEQVKEISGQLQESKDILKKTIEENEDNMAKLKAVTVSFDSQSAKMKSMGEEKLGLEQKVKKMEGELRVEKKKGEEIGKSLMRVEKKKGEEIGKSLMRVEKKKGEEIGNSRKGSRVVVIHCLELDSVSSHLSHHSTVKSQLEEQLQKLQSDKSQVDTDFLLFKQQSDSSSKQQQQEFNNQIDQLNNQILKQKNEMEIMKGQLMASAKKIQNQQQVELSERLHPSFGEVGDLIRVSAASNAAEPGSDSVDIATFEGGNRMTGSTVLGSNMANTMDTDPRPSSHVDDLIRQKLESELDRVKSELELVRQEQSLNQDSSDTSSLLDKQKQTYIRLLDQKDKIISKYETKLKNQSQNQNQGSGASMNLDGLSASPPPSMTNILSESSPQQPQAQSQIPSHREQSLLQEIKHLREELSVVKRNQKKLADDAARKAAHQAAKSFREVRLNAEKQFGWLFARTGSEKMGGNAPNVTTTN